MYPATMTEAEAKEYELKHKAKYAADTIIEAEKHKKDKNISKHLKAELKERQKHLSSAMGEKKAKAPAAAKPVKKAAKKKK